MLELNVYGEQHNMNYVLEYRIQNNIIPHVIMMIQYFKATFNFKLMHTSNKSPYLGTRHAMQFQLINSPIPRTKSQSKKVYR